MTTGTPFVCATCGKPDRAWPENPYSITADGRTYHDQCGPPSGEPLPDPIPDDVVLPCGCLIRCTVIDGVNTLTVSPCRQSCRNFQNALELAREKGIAPEFRRG